MPAFIKNKWIIILLVALIAAGLVFVVKFRSNGTVETTSPVVGDLVRTVKISGKVTPKQSVELGFEIPGTVTSIARNVGQNVRRGDVIARIDTGAISAEILKAKAELSLAEANLEKLDGAGLFEAQIENAKQALVQTIIDAYTAADDAVYNKTDQFFINPDFGRPEILYAFIGYSDLRDSINNSRVVIGFSLPLWKSLIGGLGISTYTEEKLSKSKQYLSEITSYIGDLSRAVNMFEPNDSLTQATIDKYKNDTIAARNNLNKASQDIISAEDRLRGLLLEVPVQVARVEAARASLQNFESQLSKTILTSPMNGVVSRQDAKIGQVVSSALSLVSIISQEFEIEAFIPEVLISGIKVGNTALVTLDAYGDSETFEARITHVDPGETIRDGVSTYKVKLSFSNQDERVRPGLSANISVETFRKNGARLIPERTVYREEAGTYVYILANDGSQTKIPIEIGEKDSMGNVELISDLATDARLIINPTTE